MSWIIELFRENNALNGNVNLTLALAPTDNSMVNIVEIKSILHQHQKSLKF